LQLLPKLPNERVSLAAERENGPTRVRAHRHRGEDRQRRRARRAVAWRARGWADPRGYNDL
jgi:hypothetical protein